MKKTVLVSYSGGADSVAVAQILKDQGHFVTLGYLRWDIEGSTFGGLQHKAATTCAEMLDLPLLELGHMQVARDVQSKWAWVQCACAMAFWHAAYPIMRFDAVAFGFHEATVEGVYEYGNGYIEGDFGGGGVGDTYKPDDPAGCFQHDMYPHFIPAAAEMVHYKGEVLFPVAGMTRATVWDHIPMDIRPAVWGCNIPTPFGDPCGHCFKCQYDKHIPGAPKPSTNPMRRMK